MFYIQIPTSYAERHSIQPYKQSLIFGNDRTDLNETLYVSFKSYQRTFSESLKNIAVERLTIIPCPSWKNGVMLFYPQNLAINLQFIPRKRNQVINFVIIICLVLVKRTRVAPKRKRQPKKRWIFRQLTVPTA